MNAFELIIYVEEDFQFLLIKMNAHKSKQILNDKKKMRIRTHR